jgi:EF hand domain-containing protein
VFNRQPKMIVVMLLAVVLYAGVAFEIGTSFGQVRTPDNRKPNAVALGTDEVKQLLILMDTDKNGKISKAEFMKFMEAEFDRLDKDKSGELDPKELTQSLVRPSKGAVGK